MSDVIITIQDILNQTGTMVSVTAHEDMCIGYGSIKSYTDKFMQNHLTARYHDEIGSVGKQCDDLEHAVEHISKKVAESVRGIVYAELMEKMKRNLPVK